MSSNYPPTPSFGGRYSTSHKWPPDPTSASSGEASDAYPPRPQFPPPPQAYSTNNSSFKTNTQIPGLEGNNVSPIPFVPPLQFMAPFRPSPYQQDPYAPIFTPPAGFPQQATAPPSQPNGLTENVPSIRTGATTKEYDKTQGMTAMEPPESMDLEDREEGELSNAEIEEEMEPSGSDGYQNYQPKEDTAMSYRQSHRAYERHKPHIDLDTQEQVPSTHQSSMRRHPSKAPRNSIKPSRLQSPQANKIAPEYTDQDLRSGDIAKDTFSVHGDNGNDKFALQDIHTFPKAEVKSSRESLPVTSTQSPNSRDKPDITPPPGSRTYPLYGKSPAQLRVQAQGALLGLAPHNIKFDELVNEGIDPVILKRLYDEIGLKITSTRGKQVPTNYQSNKVMIQPTAAEPLIAPNTSAELLTTPVSGSSPGVVLKSPTSEPIREASKLPNRPSTQGTLNGRTAELNKPMERKDVIARMLAAKAGKPLVSTSVVKTEAPKKSISPKNQPAVVVNDTTKDTDIPDSESPQQIPSETRSKEKNKAQTELARQRMEQLKKEGLGKSQTRSATGTSAINQPIPASNSLAQSSQNSVSPCQPCQPLASLSHPLPNRPPEPEPPSTARIPGLFMTSSEPTKFQEPSVPSMEPSSTKIRAPRKRPRASDFTDDPSPSSQNRQFAPQMKASSPQHKVIIDISEDEFMYGSDIDTAEPKRSAPERPFPVSDRNSTSNQLLTRDIPPLSDSPSRNYSHGSTPAVSTPQTPNRGKNETHLNAEIRAMRQRIAEWEKRQKDKQSASRVESPGVLGRSATTSVDENGSTATAPEGQSKPTSEPDFGLPPSSQPEDSPVHFRSPEKILNPEIQASPNSVGELRSQSVLSQNSLDPMQIESIRKKFIRKKEIESGLPVLEAELQKSEARLLQFREEEQRLLAEIEKGKAGKRRLVQELEALGIETAGLSIEELQATKDRLEEADEDMHNDQAPTQSSPKKTTAESALNLQASTSSGIAPDHGFAQSFPPSAEERRVASRFESIPKTSQEAIAMRMPPSNETEVLSSADLTDDGTTCSSSAMDESMGSTQDILDQEKMQEEPAALAEQTKTRSESIVHTEMADPDEPQSQSSLSPNGPSHAGLERQPAAPTSSPDKSDDFRSHRQSSVGSDGYEPPEPGLVPETADHMQSPPFSSALPDEVQHVAADSYSISRDVNKLTLDIQGSMTELDTDSVKDKEGAARVYRYFTPYSSPLKLFRAYRYHPRYHEDVNGGYRSLTYSHNIDPHNSICPYEAAGGYCNDHSCEYQHFRDMTLSDDKILHEMGSLREGKTPEEQEKYIEGLKQTISDMRRAKVKDLNTIATEIAGYRRRFLHDPSRVLAL
ncbi:hypothetical protein AJ78_03167 [Emergomyces pasteurianus Ep9510]|uniref:Putative zinc-finger domain-containing protein n=1 Tax=Emergomyces pasteurianus Ep9510 TaxID=1447872 RepID=A0A1J9PJR7_9EURO|nr:hypothetical protein AJ78_03167 [Emergomyces pasteurianus Ep9510]